MRAFDAAWNLLKAIPRDQVYTERNPSDFGTPRGYGYAPIIEQTRLGTMHPAIRGMLDRRRTGLFQASPESPNPYTTGKVGTIIEEIPQGMEEDMGEHARRGEGPYQDEQPPLHTAHLENDMMKPYDPSLWV
jgi:hypothetical protein